MPNDPKVTDLLDNSELGARARAVLGLALTVLTAVVGLLQGVSSFLDALPHWPWVLAASTFCTQAAVVLGRYTRLGNKGA